MKDNTEKKKHNFIRPQRNLVGMKFGDLTVIEMCGKANNIRYFSKVRCKCGREYLVADSALVNGNVKRCRNCNKPTKTHGMTHTRLFNIWSSMLQRCNNPNNSSYRDYGGRGIKVCEEWKDNFEVFADWAFTSGYEKKLSIDRINNDGDYEPSNCRWATSKQQARNKRTSVFVDYEGEHLSVHDVSEITGIKAATIIHRISHGWSDYEATHIKPKEPESYNKMRCNAIRKPIKISNTYSGVVKEFTSYSDACRYMGVNVGYIGTHFSRFGVVPFYHKEFLIEPI